MKPDYVAQGGSPLDEPELEKRARAKGKTIMATPMPVPIADNGDGTFTLQVPPPAKFDKVAYQREYMRKRRAAVKAQLK